MPPALKLPVFYTSEISMLQKIVRYADMDSRITAAQKQAIKEAIARATGILADASTRTMNRLKQQNG